MVDRPFFYVFDADTAGPSGGTLTNAATYDNLSVPIGQDAPFILRRVAGRNLVASTIQLYDRTGNYVSAARFAMPTDYCIVPEMLYDAAGQIRFNLGTIDAATASRAYGVGGSVNNYWTQLVFQGIKRFPYLKPYETPYRYFEKFHQWTFSPALTVSYTGRLAPAYQAPNPPQRFSLEILNFDFELSEIGIQILTADAVRDSTAVVSDTYLKIMLFDQYLNQLMSAPVLDSFLNCCSATNQSIFPIPPIVYPVGSQITLDIYSLLIASQVPATVYITFTGMQRLPC